MDLDRENIERSDFPSSRRGWDPDAVADHLREVANAVARQKREGSTTRQGHSAITAAEQVKAIVSVAEESAERIEEEARREAERLLSEARAASQDLDAARAEKINVVEEAAARVSRRIEELESQLNQVLDEMRDAGRDFVDGLRESATTLRGEIDEVKSGLPELSEAARRSVEAEAAAAGPPDAEPEVVQETVEIAAVAELEPEPEYEEELVPSAEEELAREVQAASEPEPEPEEYEEDVAADSGGDDGESQEGARLVALNMALNGTPREETARYLADNFDLANQDALLDDVYSRVG